MTPAEIERDLLGQGPRRGQARGRQVHQGPGAREGRGGEPRLPDPPDARLPRGGGRERRRRALPRGRRGEDPGRTCRRLASLNFIAAPREAVDRMLEQERLTRQALLPGSGTDPDLVRKVTERMATTLEVQGFLVARARPRSGCSARPGCTCWRPATPPPKPSDVTFARGPAYAPLLDAPRRGVRERAPLERPRHGGHAAARRRSGAAGGAGEARRHRPACSPGTWSRAPTASR